MTIKELIKDMEQGIENQLKHQVKPEDFKKREQKVASIIGQFQDAVMTQLFSMEVVESQIEASSSAIVDVLHEQLSATDAMSTSSQRLRDVNDESAQKIEVAMAEADEIVNSHSELSASATTLTETTESAQKVVEHQVEEISEIVDQIGKIDELSQSSVTSIANLDMAVKDIAEILGTVQNFYKQTKLLALNASIESARAGEVGKGFAVVASEIGNLAEGSASSIEKIVEIMQTIDHLIEEASLNSTKEKEALDLTVIKAKSVAGGLHEITESFEWIEDKIDIMNVSLENNHQHTNTLNKRLADTVEAFRLVEGEVDQIRTSIEHLDQHNKKIMEIESIFGEISSSLSHLTNRYNLQLLSKVKQEVLEHQQQIQAELEESILSQLVDDQKFASTSFHKTLLDNHMNQVAYIEAIWTNNIEGEFVYSNPPAGISNGKIRQWFRESLAGNSYVSDIYISGISKSPCITMSFPIISDDSIIGVLGVDVQLGYRN